MAIKLTSWNVNGIRAVMKKGFMEFFNENESDILCLQETKASPEQVNLDIPNYDHYWNSAEKKGYSGTVIFTKLKPLNVENGLGIEKHDSEGRVITMEFDKWFLVNCYTPNAKRDLSRLPYRYAEWDIDFLNYVKHLEKRKPVVFVGDLNVAHTEDDLANPQSNKTTKSRPGNAGFTDQERESFDNIVKAGFIDSFREFYQGNGHYTWWSYMGNSRARNVGWRIDYICLSAVLKDKLKSASILPEVMGSDHCPVEVELDI